MRCRSVLAVGLVFVASACAVGDTQGQDASRIRAVLLSWDRLPATAIDEATADAIAAARGAAVEYAETIEGFAGSEIDDAAGEIVFYFRAELSVTQRETLLARIGDPYAPFARTARRGISVAELDAAVDTVARAVGEVHGLVTVGRTDDRIILERSSQVTAAELRVAIVESGIDLDDLGVPIEIRVGGPIVELPCRVGEDCE